MTGTERAQAEKTWASRLLERRMTLGMTQAQLAEASGVTQQAISRLEHNTAAQPRLTTMEALARATGTKVDALFPWESRPLRVTS